jgi:hypothetical protein
MTVRYGLEDFLTEPFPEFHHPLLMTRWAEMAAFARKSQKVFMAAVKPALARLTPFKAQYLGSLPRKRSLAIDTGNQIWARDSGKSPVSRRAGKSRTVWQSDHRKPIPAFQNGPLHIYNTGTLVVCEAGKLQGVAFIFALFFKRVHYKSVTAPLPPSWPL